MVSVAVCYYLRCEQMIIIISVYFSFAEGVRDRERACIGTLLKSLSFIRDNTYHLHRHLWNDVHEDWPFYTEQDRQSLKR